MRLTISAIAALLFLAMASTDVPAQRLDRILGPIVGPVNSLLKRGTRRVLRPYMYRSRAHRRSGAARRAVAGTPQRDAAQSQVAEPKPFWPDAHQDMLDYVLLSDGSGLWTHGYGAIVVSMFTQPPKIAERQQGGTRLAASDNAGQTVGAASAGDANICGQRGANRADDATTELGNRLALAKDQQTILAELRSAMRRAENEMLAACPRSVPASLPERLRTMQDRLWAMRVTAVNLRAPLRMFLDALTDEQEAKLGRLARDENKAVEANNQCQALSQLAPQWPADEMSRALRPNKDQQAAFETLSKTSSQMNLLMMGSCPQKTPATPLVRLDSTLDWLDAMLFAGVNMTAAVDDFYRSLSEEQKAKLDKLDL